MRELLVMLILSFLVFLNVRLWGVHEFSFPGAKYCGRATCDIPIDGIDMYNSGSSTDFLDVGTLCVTKQMDQEVDAYAIDIEKIGDLPVVYDEREKQTQSDQVCMNINTVFPTYMRHSQFNELTLQQLIQLITNEMTLIERMIYPTMGSARTVIKNREKLLSNALPTVKIFFNILLNTAVQSPTVSTQMKRKKDSDIRNLHKLLTRDEKKHFLHTAYQCLFDTRRRLHDIQHRIALRNVGPSL